MKDIKFYNIEPTIVGDIPTFLVEEAIGGDFAFSDDVKQLQARIEELEHIVNHIIDYADEQVIDDTVTIPVFILSDINLYYENFSVEN